MGEIRVERREDRSVIEISNPARRNAISFEMFVDLGQLIEELATDPDVRVVVLRGEGGDFCSGADLAAPRGAQLDPHERLSVINRTARAIHDFPKPLIGCVRGHAYGAGLNLALACDVVVADSTVRVSEVFVRRGLSIDFGGSWLLPRFVGLRRAMQMALTGEEWRADEVVASGLFNAVVAPGELDDAVDGWVERLRAAAPVAYRLTKSMLNQSFESSFDACLEAEARCQALNRSTVDPAEGWAAFTERRAPVFSGRFR